MKTPRDAHDKALGIHDAERSARAELRRTRKDGDRKAVSQARNRAVDLNARANSAHRALMAAMDAEGDG